MSTIWSDTGLHPSSWAVSDVSRCGSYLHGLDESQVVLCDVVVKGLHLPEVLVVMGGEGGDVVVLAVLHLVKLALPHAVLLQNAHLLLITGLDFCSSGTRKKTLFRA